MEFEREPGWLHPSSLLFGVIASLRRFAVAIIIAFLFSGAGNTTSLGLTGLLVIIATLQVTMHYLTFRYLLSENTLFIDEGWLFRRHRTIPVNRIQNLELTRNPLHHLFNVAEVRIETAGGNEPEASLRVLGMDEIQRLREAIFRLRSHGQASSPLTLQNGESSAQNESSVDYAEPLSAPRLVHAIPTSQLLLAGLLSNRGFVIIPIALGIVQQLRIDERFDVKSMERLVPQNLSTLEATLAGLGLVLVLLALLKLVSISWYLLRFYDYKMERLEDDIRIKCGFFTQRSATIPRHRIQFMSVQQSLLGRLCGIASVRIETAGGAGPNQEKEATAIAGRWFLPVVPMVQVPALLEELRAGFSNPLENLHWHSPHPKTFRRLMRVVFVQASLSGAIGALLLGPWGSLVSLPAFVVLSLFAHRKAASIRYARTEIAVYYQSGFITRKLSMTFFDKIQNLELLQSWFDRRWGMARVAIDTAAAGPAQHKIESKFLPTQLAFTEYENIAIRIDQTPPSSKKSLRPTYLAANESGLTSPEDFTETNT